MGVGVGDAVTPAIEMEHAADWPLIVAVQLDGDGIDGEESLNPKVVVAEGASEPFHATLAIVTLPPVALAEAFQA